MEFKKPPDHVPDGVIGDTLDEVPQPDIGSDYTVPYEHTSDFQPPPNYTPDHVVGDTLDEVQTPFQTPQPHVPDNVIGDTLDEVPQPSPLSVPNPPLEPQPYPTPDPHVPNNVVGDDVSEVPQPPPLSVPNPPLEPSEFQETPMPPPGDPVDVQVGPPHEPDDSVEQPDLSIEPLVAPRAPQFATVRHSPSTAEGILRRLRETDEKLARYVEELGGDEWAPFASTIGGQGSRAADPLMNVKVFQNYLQQVGPTGIATFTALQVALHALNKKYGRVFNPFYLNNPLPPGIQKVALDTEEKIHEDFVNNVEDRAVVTMSTMNEGPVGETLRENSYSAENPYDEGSVLSQTAFVDLALGDEQGDIVGVPLARSVTQDVPYGNGLTRKHVDHSKIFDQRGRLLPEFSAGSPTRRVSRENEVLAQSSFNWKGSKGVIPAAFDVEDEEYGYVTSPLPDDITYVPLMLQDLRPTANPLPNTDGTRRVYFRALNLQTSEAFTPNWNEEEAWGRVDPVMGYRNTGRQISVSFYCHAFTPEDLPVMYKKRTWLTSMVYPEVSSDLMLRAGPVVRLRVGDLYNNSNGGLPGVIRDLNFDDSEQVWELKRGYKVPRGFTVSFTIQVLHEGTPGINDGHFTVVRANVPERRPDDPSRFEDIRTETDDGLFNAFNPPRSRRS